MDDSLHPRLFLSAALKQNTHMLNNCQLHPHWWERKKIVCLHVNQHVFWKQSKENIHAGSKKLKQLCTCNWYSRLLRSHKPLHSLHACLPCSPQSKKHKSNTSQWILTFPLTRWTCTLRTWLSFLDILVLITIKRRLKVNNLKNVLSSFYVMNQSLKHLRFPFWFASQNVYPMPKRKINFSASAKDCVLVIPKSLP